MAVCFACPKPGGLWLSTQGLTGVVKSLVKAFSIGYGDLCGALDLIFKLTPATGDPGRLQRAGGSGAVIEIPRSGVVRGARSRPERHPPASPAAPERPSWTS